MSDNGFSTEDTLDGPAPNSLAELLAARVTGGKSKPPASEMEAAEEDSAQDTEDAEAQDDRAG